MIHGLLVFFGLVLFICPALAQKRVALLIGNQTYTQEIGPLSNPVNDVNLIAGTLEKIGFARSDITIVKNGSRRQILRAIEKHTVTLAKAGNDAVGFLYYSGHGVANQLDRRNYLIPVDVKRFDADVWFDAIPLDEIVSKLSKRAPRAANFVIFDACRNVLNAPIKGGKGFVPVRTRRGMLIAFSTDPGQTASDAGQGGGPYAKALSEQLAKPGQHHLDLFQNVKEQVHSKTGVQVPWTRDGMLQRVYLAGKRSILDRRAEIAFWRSVSQSNDPVVVRTYLQSYPDGEFAVLARALAKNLERAKKKDAVSSILLPQVENAGKKGKQTILARLPNEPEVEQKSDKAKIQQLPKPGTAVPDANTQTDQVETLDRETSSREPARDTNEPNLLILQLAKNLQTHLARVGCDPGDIDGVWGPKSQRSIANYNRYTNSKLDDKAPSIKALEHVKRQKQRVCPISNPLRPSSNNNQQTTPNAKSQSKTKSARKRKDCMPFTVCLRKCQNDELPYPAGNCARVCGDYLVNTCKR